MSMLQAQVTANPVSFSQIAAIEAWSGDQRAFHRMLTEFDQRKKLLEKGLEGNGGFKNTSGQGAVFIFPNASFYFEKTIGGKRINNSQDFCDVLLENGVATVPGNYFGDQYSENIRFSYSSATREEISDAIRIIRDLTIL